MKRLSRESREAVLAALVEGNSLRAVSRMTGVARMTVEKLFRDLGTVCAEYHDKAVRGLSSKRIQCDEIWSFVYAKEKNVPEDKRGEFGYGDVWTWVGIDADSKLVISWLVGRRDAGCAYTIMHDIADRLRGRVQLTTDGLKSYLEAVESAFGSGIDYAQLVKIYGQTAEGEKRYSPAVCIGCETKAVSGDPDPRHVSTSYIERQNLTMRMGMRRFTRLTNGFSKRIENHRHAISIHYMWYNFGRVHQTLRVTPAMEAGISDHVWTRAEIVALLEAVEPSAVEVGERRKDRSAPK